MSLRRKRILLAVAFASAIAFWYSHHRAGTVIPQSDVAKLEIELFPWRDELSKPTVAASVTVEDQGRIADVLASLKPAVPNEDHKCSSRGQIRFIQSNGSQVTIEFLPGHDVSHYEFRLNNKNYRVPRADFVRALLPLGIEVPLDF